MERKTNKAGIPGEDGLCPQSSGAAGLAPPWSQQCGLKGAETFPQLISTWIPTSHTCLLCTLGYNSFLFILLPNPLQLWTLQSFSFGSSVTWTYPPLCVFWFCLWLSDTKGYWRLIFYIPYPNPRINHFSQESCLLLLCNRRRAQCLVPRYGTDVSLTPGLRSDVSKGVLTNA